MSVVIAALLIVSGSIYEDTFAQGNRAYIAGNLEEAIHAYEQLLASGVDHPSACYNLGNAYYHRGDTGRAMLNYERALRIDPNYAPAERGIQAVTTSANRPLDMPADFRTIWSRDSRLGNRLILFLGLFFWWALWGILVFAVWCPIPHTRKLVSACVAVLVLLAAVALFRAEHPRAAVVVAEASPLRYGPDPRDGIRLQLQSGDRVWVERVDGAWARLKTGTGIRGWTRYDEIHFIAPPYRHEQL